MLLFHFKTNRYNVFTWRYGWIRKNKIHSFYRPITFIGHWIYQYRITNGRPRLWNTLSQFYVYVSSALRRKIFSAKRRILWRYSSVDKNEPLGGGLKTSADPRSLLVHDIRLNKININKLTNNDLIFCGLLSWYYSTIFFFVLLYSHVVCLCITRNRPTHRSPAEDSPLPRPQNPVRCAGKTNAAETISADDGVCLVVCGRAARTVCRTVVICKCICCFKRVHTTCANRWKLFGACGRRDNDFYGAFAYTVLALGSVVPDRFEFRCTTRRLRD